MTDLTFTGLNNPGKVYTWSDTANKRFVVSYLDVPFFGNNALGYAGQNSFQVILDARDSSITFQYAKQMGNIDPILQSRSHPFVVGIEDQTGRFGLTVWDSLPATQLAIRLDPPAHPLVEAQDATIFWLQNAENRAFFVPYVAPPNAPKALISAAIGNIGNEAFMDPIQVKFQLGTGLGFNYMAQDSLLPPYARASLDTLDFALPFFLPFPTTYSLILELSNPHDINPHNDSLMVEMVVVDTFGGRPWLSYVTDMDAPERADGIEGLTDSSGKSGIGAYFRPFGDPVEIEAVEFFFSPYPDSFGRIYQGDAYRVEIYAESRQERKPGQLLFSQTIAARDVYFGRWTGIRAMPPIPVDSGGFYVAWIPLSDSLALLSESSKASPPISRQTFEIQNGSWKAHRSNDTKDFWIRARINTSQITDLEDEIREQGAFQVYPNPGDGLFFLEAQLPGASPLRLQVFDIQGKRFYQESYPTAGYFRQFIDLRNLAQGTYLMYFQYENGSQSRWISILDAH